MRLIPVFLCFCLAAIAGADPAEGQFHKPSAILKPNGKGEFWAETVTFSPCGNFLATNSTVWDIKTQKQILTFAGNASWDSQVGFTSDGARVLHITGKQLEVLESKNGKRLQSIKFDQDIRALAISRQYIILARADNAIDLLSSKDYRFICSLSSKQSSASPVTSLSMSGDEKFLASAHLADRTTGEIYVWDISAKRSVHSITGIQEKDSDSPQNPITSIAMSPDGAKVCAVGWHGKLRMWNIEKGNELQALTIGYHPSHLTLTGNWSHFASTTHDGCVVYGQLAPKGYKSTQILNRSARGVAIAPDGKWLAVGDFDGNVRLFSSDLLK